MRQRSLLFALAGLFTSFSASFGQSQPRYLVLFKDKLNSPFSITKPSEFLSERAVLRRSRQNIAIIENDLPVNPAYITAVKATGAKAIFPSKWFNGLVVEASAEQFAAIKQLSFYKGTELDLPIANIISKSPGVERSAAITQKFESAEELDYGRMRDQLALLGVDVLHQKGFHGENMLIGVLDNGFAGADGLAFFKPLFDEKRVLDTYDFLRRDNSVYDEGTHGLHVLSTIAADQPGIMIGAAFKANFVLYQTESDYIESPYEEVTWLIGAERADSIGVDVINSSLGYYTFDGEFDSPAYNHTYEDMDGKTTIISRAARYATRKGILVVNAAGNDGPAGYIAAPADVDSVLSVGATNYQRDYSAFSSIGPNALGQQKPDVAAVGSGTIIGGESGSPSSGSGTSYSSPQIAGLAAILWQAYPTLTAQQLFSALKRSGHLAANPNNLLGFGVPDATRAEEIIQKELVLGTEPDPLKQLVLSPNPAQKFISLTVPFGLIGQKASVSVHLPNGSAISDQKEVLKEQMSMSTENLSPGLYVLRVQVKDRIRALKFIKQ